MVIPTATISVPSSSQAIPPQEKNWLSVSTSLVMRDTERAATLLGVVGDGEPVDVGEGAAAQAVERLLAAGGQAGHRGPVGDRRDEDADGGDHGQPDDDVHLDLAVGEALVDGLLDEDRHDDPPAGTDEGEQERADRAVSQLGAGPPAALQRVERAPVVAPADRRRSHELMPRPGRARRPRPGGGTAAAWSAARRGRPGPPPDRRPGTRPRRPARSWTAGWPPPAW